MKGLKRNYGGERRPGRRLIRVITGPFTTIIDSNVTTIIAALFLYQFGTGPVRGFAVTLFWGITANIFTAVFVTRWIFDYLTLKVRVKKLSI